MNIITNIKKLKNFGSNVSLTKKIEMNKTREEFKKGAMSVYISIKGRSVNTALKEFVYDYDPDQYFGQYTYDKFVKDDSIKVYFTVKLENKEKWLTVK